MELRDALSQIDEIRDRIEGAQIYRGYRAAPAAASSVLAVGGALAQDAVLGPGPSGRAFALYWGSIAVLGCLVLGAWLVGYCRRSDPRQGPRRTRAALEQLLPSFVAGALVSFALFGVAPRLLPGLWQVFFGLGLFASRRCLPAPLAWIAAGYVLCGAWLCGSGGGFSPWAMGLPFGIGQAATALVLFRALEVRAGG